MPKKSGQRLSGAGVPPKPVKVGADYRRAEMGPKGSTESVSGHTRRELGSQTAASNRKLAKLYPATKSKR